jgi:ankyrin repeat protein
VDVLVKAGADVNQPCTKEPYSVPLGIAAQEVHTKTVQRLLEAGANVNHQNKDGVSPLHAASQEEAGADVHQATTESGDVPLGIAALQGHLLAAGATVNHQNKSGRTPVYSASMKGHAAVVQLLIQKGADISLYDKDGLSPLYVASQDTRRTH